MRLRSQHHFCIWCNRDLAQLGRSDEHIIPENIFGNVITDDLCADCNHRFGAELDHAFLNDGTTLSTAFEGGVQPEELLTRYRARQSNDQGLTIETSVRRGVSSVIPQLDRADGPLIGDKRGAFDPNQLRGMKRRTIERAQAHRPDLPPDEVSQRVEALYARFLGPESQDVVHDPETGQGLRRYVVESRPVLFGDQADAELVSRAAGKILYESLHSLLPFAILRLMRVPLSQLRQIVLGHDPVANSVGHRRLDLPAARQHTIKVYGGGDTAGCLLILFGNIEWKFSVSFENRFGQPGRVPPFETTIPISF